MMTCTNIHRQGNFQGEEHNVGVAAVNTCIQWCTCRYNRQHLLGRLALLLWCGELLLQALQLVLVLQQGPRLQVVDVQGQVLTQNLNLKLQVELWARRDRGRTTSESVHTTRGLTTSKRSTALGLPGTISHGGEVDIY